MSTVTAPERERAAVRMPGRTWWRVEPQDIAWLIALTLVAGILRFASPVFLDFFTHPGTAAPITAWGIGHNF